MIRRLSFELRYAFGTPPWDSGVSPPELLALLAEQLPGRAIDIGCGTGTNAITMAQHGWQVLGIDFSGLAIRRARRKAAHAGVEVELRRGDVAHLDLDQIYDLALDIGCFHAVPDTDRPGYARAVSRALVPGGTYLLYSFLGNWVSESALRALFEASFKILETDRGRDVVGDRPSAWFMMRRKPA